MVSIKGYEVLPSLQYQALMLMLIILDTPLAVCILKTSILTPCYIFHSHNSHQNCAWNKIYNFSMLYTKDDM